MHTQVSAITTLQLPEIWNQTDNWTGTTSATERRRRQNRLSQRAYRKRKHLNRLASNKKSHLDAEVADVQLPIIPIQQTQSVGIRFAQLTLAHIKDPQILFLVYCIECPKLRQDVERFLQKAFTEWNLNLPRLGSLPVITRLNALDALIRNALVMRIPFETLDNHDCNSLFNLKGPQKQDAPQTFPAHLCPTVVQRAVSHHSWLDLFPIPGMRDNILRGIQAGQLDEDSLRTELCCELLNLRADTTAPLVIWGDSWDIKGWEFSHEFFKKWGKLLQGCPEVLHATNYWREKRGEVKLAFVFDC